VPFAPKIRKDILSALDDHVIPALKSQKVLQVLAEPPYDFPDLKYWVKREKPLPDRPHDPLQVVRNWWKENMVSISDTSFGFIYHGAGYEQIGVTTSAAKIIKAKKLPVPPGITVLQLSSPAIICYPPYAPHAKGSPDDWIIQNNLKEDVRVLAFSIVDNTLRVFISVRTPSLRETSHSLQVDDPLLAQIASIYLDELRQPANHENAQAQLLILMCRLRRYLQNHRAVISNSCWIKPATAKVKNSAIPSKHARLCLEAQNYIQYHLSQPLSLSSLAEHFEVSPFHFNNVFQEVLGTTVMRYITSLRIDVAKRIIADTPERISDVAELTGFSSTASFCTVFRKTTGCSPGEFRERSHQSTNNKFNKKQQDAIH
jgi:AraC-like DNA-binding protein